MKKYLVLTSITLLVASCGQEYPETSMEFRVDDGEFLIDYTEFDYVYARAEALPRTNLEPAPTSYVLFPRFKLKEAITELSEETEQALRDARQEQDERVNAYCLEHYKQFDSLATRFEEDPFGNVVTFYWPVRASEGEALSVLMSPGETAESKCAFLTARYDYDRAEALISSLLDTEIAATTQGPVMVLDVGFAALAVPMDNIKTANMDRLPSIWKQAIEDALARTRLARSELTNELQQVESEMTALEESLESGNLSRRETSEANKQLGEKQQRRQSLLQRLFGKNSWGRSILCGFAPLAVGAAAAFIPDTQPVETKISRICGPS